jgi:hypothetical protein
MRSTLAKSNILVNSLKETKYFITTASISAAVVKSKFQIAEVDQILANPENIRDKS